MSNEPYRKIQAKKYTSYITKFLFAFNIITELLNIYYFAAWVLGLFDWVCFHHTHCGPWTLATICSWKVMKTAICWYLLIIHLSSEHLRGHPVGGADDSQRLLVLLLTAVREEAGIDGGKRRENDGGFMLNQHLFEALKSISQHLRLKGVDIALKF